MKDPITIRPEGEPDEGWAYVVLSSPETSLRLEGQPSPKSHIKFRTGETEIDFTLIGTDKDRLEAYYLKGLWDYKDQAPEGPVLNA